jgi:tetratricopeptide (TPR) repeat protein
MSASRRLCVAAVWGATSLACATTSPLSRQLCYNPDVQLAKVLRPLEDLRAKGCEIEESTAGPMTCDGLQQELQRLMVICPNNTPILIANAVVAYDERNPVQAQQFLDQALGQPGRFPDAAVLRARIAIEDGNVPFARRLLEQHIRLVPDHAGLHETLGAALYLEGRLPEATLELTTARALGAPAWRIAYHLGLVEEAAGRFEDASRHYGEALQGNPSWPQAQSRFNALRARTAKP